jgi:ArsR family transcriptional regulator, arsenate/arsenite/antimonite-responsive transcriptional repressor
MSVNVPRVPNAKKPTPCCSPVLQGRLSKDDAEALASALRALADPTRLRLLSFIAAQPEGEACVCHLTAPVELSQPTVSHHLKILNDEGLLEREKRGTWVYYRVARERMEAVRAALVTTPPRQRSAKRA